MESLILTGLGLGVGLFLLLLPIYLTKRYNNGKLLLKELGLTHQAPNGEVVYPKFKRKKNKLIFYKYSPAITVEDFGVKELTAFSKVFSKSEKDSFVLAEYEESNLFSKLFLGHNKNKLVLYSSQIKQTDFFNDCPKLGLYEFWIGKDLKGKDATYSLHNKNSISIYGQMGLGKSTLANAILTSLNKSSDREFIFTKSKADYIKGHQTTFCSKDDEPKMLGILKSLKEEAIKKQLELDELNLQSIFQTNDKLTVLVFDEAHSYLRSAPGLSREEKEIRSQIISLVEWFLKQCRSVGYVVVFILPSAERSELDINTREVSYIFSTKIPSEMVSRNIFSSPIASLIPAKTGLFVSSDDFQTRLVQVASIKRSK